MIKKEADGYHVYSEKGKHLGGPYSKKKAEKRLHQIEFFKHQNESSYVSFKEFVELNEVITDG